MLCRCRTDIFQSHLLRLDDSVVELVRGQGEADGGHWVKVIDEAGDGISM